jgi:predicted DNA-binding transcriptional regulator YafY
LSHDADKLIRQLSLIAFLMAERRPLTARDIKGCVEGYSEMSDEAFARRFYSDRAELLSLGVPLQSQRDEFTGEELYTLRSEQYFLPALELTDGELAALQTALFLLEGQFAYAEPLRLALQNLALGRPNPPEAQTASAVTVDVRGNDYSPEMPGWLTKLDAAITKQRTVRFRYWSIGRDEITERTVNPYVLYSDNGVWYLAGKDLDRDDIRTFRVSRISGDITFATRRERDFRAPEDFDPAQFRGRPPWQIGDIAGEARIEVEADTAWWVARSYAGRGRLEDGVFTTEYADLRQLAGWILRQNGRARPLDPPELMAEVENALRRAVESHEGEPPKPERPRPRRQPAPAPERPASPVPPERFAVLQALLAHLLAACGDEKRTVIPAADLVERFRIPQDQLDEHLQLLNLVNFGGGCYAVYAVLDGDEVRVEKELFGDAFRRAPRLTPLEARAIRLALEFVGPMIAAEAKTTLDGVRAKLEETFGQFELREGPGRPAAGEEEELVATLTRAVQERRVVEIEYLSADGDVTTERTIEPHSLERALPYWYVHAWDRDRNAVRSFRFDRMRSARPLDQRFEPRPELDVESSKGTARVLFSSGSARFRVERGATELDDGTALEEIRFGSPRWLVTEILAACGDAIVLEPADLRALVAERARELLRELVPARAER